jgi:hypothetical protein
MGCHPSFPLFGELFHSRTGGGDFWFSSMPFQPVHFAVSCFYLTREFFKVLGTKQFGLTQNAFITRVAIAKYSTLINHFRCATRSQDVQQPQCSHIGGNVRGRREQNALIRVPKKRRRERCKTIRLPGASRAPQDTRPRRLRR